MVVVKIGSPYYDEEAGDLGFRLRATVVAKGHDLKIEGERDLLADGMLPVIDVWTGRQLSASDDAEAWARNLPYAFRAGDLIAEVLVDAKAPAHPTRVSGVHREPPHIPDAPLSHFRLSH